MRYSLTAKATLVGLLDLNFPLFFNPDLSPLVSAFWVVFALEKFSVLRCEKNTAPSACPRARFKISSFFYGIDDTFTPRIYYTNSGVIF
jgi:hypothetical protein